MVVVCFILKDLYRFEITTTVIKHILNILFSLSGTLLVVKLLFGILRKTYSMFPYESSSGGLGVRAHLPVLTFAEAGYAWVPEGISGDNTV